MHEKETILFFDGVCGLCNGLVDWLLPRDRRERLKFATLQGTTAKALLPPSYVTDLDTSVLWRQGRLLTRSDAVLGCFQELGGVWAVVAWLRFLPRAIREPVYGMVARNRYGWFGKRHTCRMPLPGERLRFLD